MQMAKIPLCPACGSAHLSPRTSYASFDNHLRYSGLGKPGLLGSKDLTVSASSASVCLDCGYLLLFASPEDVSQIIEAFQRG
jgi:hypothetical protein